MFSHQKLKVYRRSISFQALVIALIRALPTGNSDLANQLRRAAMSVSLNIAEGAGKTSIGDKKRFYSIARGSALECAAIFDLLSAWGLVESELLQEPFSLLHEIVAL